jgi:transcriptional activator SPT8
MEGDRIFTGRRNSTVDEYDLRNEKFVAKFEMPQGSGMVSNVQIMPNSRHLLVASDDNIR